MKKRTLFLLGVCAFSATIIWNTPAAFVMPHVKERVQGLSYSDVSGTIWNGKLQHVIFRKVRLGNVSWSLKPLSIIKGGLTTALAIDDTEMNFTGDVSVNLSKQVNLEEANFTIKAEWLDQIKALSRKAKLSGEFMGQVDHLEWSPENPEPPLMTGRLNWIKGGVTSPIQLKEGNYAFTIEPDDATHLAVDVRSKDAPIKTQGKITLDKQWRYNTDIQLIPKPEEGTLTRLLSLAVKPDGKGIFHIKQKGTLPPPAL